MSKRRRLVSRIAKHRGEWMVMQTNVSAADMRDDREPEYGEEASVYVPNVLAAAAPDLLEVAQEAKDLLAGYDLTDEEEALYGRLLTVIARATGEEG